MPAKTRSGRKEITINDVAKGSIGRDNLTGEAVKGVVRESPGFAEKSEADSDTVETYQGSTASGPLLIWEKSVNGEIVEYDTIRNEEKK